MTSNTSTEISLPVRGGVFARLTEAQRAKLSGIGSATIAATLHHLGVPNVTIRGPLPLQQDKGFSVVGSALTLQFMPQRADIASGQTQEAAESKSALWAVFDSAEPGDVLVVQAYADPDTGCVGEMLASAFRGRGGLAMVIDGRIRDWPKVKSIDLPIWATGVTPNYASQGNYFPWAYDVPVNCGGVLILPGDAIIADGDGAVVVPKALIDTVADSATATVGWEEFSRKMVDAGGPLSKYYPLSPEAEIEYDRWREQDSQ